MEVQTQGVSDTPQESSSALPEDNQTEMKKSDKVAYDTYRRVLGEKKKQDSKLKELEEKLKGFEHKELETQGKKDELIDSLRKQLNETKNSLDSERKNYAWSSISSQIANEARKQGCKDVDLLLKTFGKEDFSSLEVGDASTGYQVNNDDLAYLIEGSKKKHEVLFGREVHVNDMTPRRVETSAPKSLNDMKIEELINLAKRAK